jgi:integrase/recombinase XerD
MNKLSNVRIRLAYQGYIKEALGNSEKSNIAAMSALSIWEKFTKGREFHRVHPKLVIAFKRHLLEHVSETTGKPFSVSTVVHILGHCHAFYQWLVKRKGYKSIDQTAIDYFKATRRQMALARSPTPRRVPLIEDVVSMILALPFDTIEQRRDRAIVVFLLLTGLRAGALASLLVKHVDLKWGAVLQVASEVRTKSAKTILTFLLRIDPAITSFAINWVQELKDLGFPADSPLFPPHRLLQAYTNGIAGVSAADLQVWSNSTPVRRIIKAAFESHGLDYCTPHQFRHAIVQYYLARGITLDQAWCLSINLGHKSLGTTLAHYGMPTDERRQSVIQEMGLEADPEDTGALVLGFLSWCKQTRPKAAAAIAAILASPD